MTSAPISLPVVMLVGASIDGCASIYGLDTSEARESEPTEFRLGIVSAALAAPFGVAMAVMMVEVVNRRAFGRTLDLTVAWRVLLESSALAVLAALLAGLYPAWKMARARPGDALRGSG